MRRSKMQKMARYAEVCRLLPVKLRNDIATAVDAFANQLENDRGIFAATKGHERIAEEYGPRIEELRDFAANIES